MVVAAILLPGIQRQRAPKFGGHGEFELLGHHPHHGVVHQVEPNGPADDAAVGGESPFPQSVAEHNLTLASGLVPPVAKVRPSAAWAWSRGKNSPET